MSLKTQILGDIAQFKRCRKTIQLLSVGATICNYYFKPPSFARKSKSSFYRLEISSSKCKIFFFLQENHTYLNGFARHSRKKDHVCRTKHTWLPCIFVWLNLLSKDVSHMSSTREIALKKSYSHLSRGCWHHLSPIPNYLYTVATSLKTQYKRLSHQSA